MLRAFSNDTSSYDSDEEPPVNKDRVSSWRLDPEESLSDWTVEIVLPNNGKMHATYHVHKQNLAVGPRKSEYFAKLFSQGGRFAENKESTSRIPMDELAAQSFPIVLDYLYSEGDKLPLSTNNATALHSMAKYFDMRRLKWEAKQFWQKDIERADNCAIYYEHASILNNDKILDAALKVCSERILSITKTSRLIQVLDPEVWLRILQDMKDHQGRQTPFEFEEMARHASILIAEFFQQNPGLEADKFQQLTDENLLPHIHVEAAIPLLDAERVIMAAALDESRLSNFQDRCIAAIIQDWDSMDLQSQGRAMELAKKQSPTVLVEILSGTLSAAKKNKVKLKNELQTKTKELSNYRKTYGPLFYYSNS